MKQNNVLKVGLIGTGLQGGRRAPVLKQIPGNKLALIAGKHRESAEQLAKTMECETTDNWKEVVERKDIDAVLVCTPPNLHAEMSIAAMNNGKHVLCEKPLARTVEEAEEMIKVAKANGVILKCGFNHRHHPGVLKAREWIDDGVIGDLNMIRCRYGICGRIGYEKEWRADPEIVSGGHMMEQGIHAVDLSRWFLKEITDVVGFTATYFWNTAPLEDNTYALLRTGKKQMVFIHSSLTEWINMFSFEILGQDGYITIEGLGGGYGTERVTLVKRALTEPFRKDITQFRGGDRSWYGEWMEFISAIEEKREPMGNAYDGLIALKIVNAIYQSNRTGSVVRL